jgi:hypothetical protein
MSVSLIHTQHTGVVCKCLICQRKHETAILLRQVSEDSLPPPK